MNVFKQLWRSLYSPKDIARFRFQGIGKTILFLFILSFLSLIPSIVQVIQFGNTIFNEGESLIQNELPYFEVQNDTLVSSNEDPFSITIPSFTVIVDDSGTITPDDLTNDTNTMALLQNEVVIVTGGELQQSPYSMFTGFSFSSEGIASLLSSLNDAKIIIFSVIFFVMYVVSSSLMFIKVTIFAAIGVLFAKTLDKKLNYRHSYRLTAYSVALPTIFFTIVALIGSNIPAASFVNWLVTSIMLYLSIKEIPSRKQKKDIPA
ncbi:DUF1189 domain-containing protein [Jeotgalibacillus soli]|uniref:DUF1189 domain-containing protein n=1 Tax=Jeotgalibacillus soli TaxID=889306 RepID=A0A0C2R2A9_9BACL|nr:DUF1189 domain-containing protein [Jeotgalibacillus soli]KIL44415.1 hypothetical protein KP78_33790 [Jeotgalibacillus soli]